MVPVAKAGDVANAEISLQVNGTDRQRSTVSKLIWNIGETIEHLSTAWELQPGDLIFTGTPGGTGSTRTPRRYLKPGDQIVSTIEGLGRLSNHCISDRR